MFELNGQNELEGAEKRLAAVGYWPAIAAAAFASGKYSRVVEVCRLGLAEEPGIVSGRVTYARALYHAGQVESAVEQFYEVLARDPENLVALKYLGDIKWGEGDEYAAVAHYRRVLEIDPWCRELRCEIATAASRPRNDGDGGNPQQAVGYSGEVRNPRQGAGADSQLPFDSAQGDNQAGRSQAGSEACSVEKPDLRFEPALPSGSGEPSSTLRVLDLHKGSQDHKGPDLREIRGESARESGETLAGSAVEVTKEAGEVTKEAALRTITLKREAEAAKPATQRARLREVPFYTETIGDLYLAQGHFRLAAEVYRELYGRGGTSRLKEKLENAEKKAGKE